MTKRLPSSKLLVQHVRSRKFLRATGRWTKRARQAFNFPSVLTAINMCLARRLKDVQLIVRERGTRHRIPLDGV